MKPRQVRLPDYLGGPAATTILTALNLEAARVAAVRIDWNAGTVQADLYVCDRDGRHVLDASGHPILTTVEYPT